MPDQHPMTAEAVPNTAIVRFTCTHCSYCVNVDTATGDFQVVQAGDRQAAHSGSNFDQLGATVNNGLTVAPRDKPVLH